MARPSKRFKGEPEQGECSAANGLNINDMPREILMEILRFYVHEAGERKLLYPIAKVCRLWRSIAADPFFWNNHRWENNKVFATSEDSVLHMMGPSHRAKEPYFKSIDCSPHLCTFPVASRPFDCNSGTLQELSKHAGTIRRLTVKQRWIELLPSMFSILLRDHGVNLTKIDLQHCLVLDMASMLKSIAYSCRELRQLYISGYSPRDRFPINLFQSKCKKLTTLATKKMNFLMSRCAVKRGFPEMESFTCEYQCGAVDDAVLSCMLGQSRKLRVLEIPHSMVTANAILNLITPNLQVLNLSHTPILSCSYLTNILMRWRHSLKTLNLTKNGDTTVVQNAFLSYLLTDGDRPPLERLHLPCVDVKSRLCKEIMFKCPNLQYLDLCFCMQMPEPAQT